jgi:primase-polymerase (primpol)-like protein
MGMVEFGIRGYDYGYNKVSADIFSQVWIWVVLKLSFDATGMIIISKCDKIVVWC